MREHSIAGRKITWKIVDTRCVLSKEWKRHNHAAVCVIPCCLWTRGIRWRNCAIIIIIIITDVLLPHDDFLLMLFFYRSSWCRNHRRNFLSHHPFLPVYHTSIQERDIQYCPHRLRRVVLFRFVIRIPSASPSATVSVSCGLLPSSYLRLRFPHRSKRESRSSRPAITRSSLQLTVLPVLALSAHEYYE